MLENNSITVQNISKSFKDGFERTSVIKGVTQRNRREARVVEALKDINFSVRKGEAFGIAGSNASGKTTLLKLIAGILKPTGGEINVHGDMIAFLQLGLGFQDELTAIENIYFYAAFLGMDRRETHVKLAKIVEFSELGDFLNMKLKFFSTGMRARLAFSVIVQAHTDVILLDEFLAVGDIHFRKKCLNEIEVLKKKGVTMILVSQNLEGLKRLCERALLLDSGRQVMVDGVDAVIERYKSLNGDT